MNIIPLCDESIQKTASILNNGGVAVIPTDTVYGLAAHPDFPEAVERLYTIKNRIESKPIAFLASDITNIKKFGACFPPDAESIANKFWPGALTLVLDCNNGCKEGFRIPDFAPTRKLLAMCGGLLRVTSANLSGQRAATDAPSALKDIGLDTDIILDGGISPGGKPSSVIYISPNNEIKILRHGDISQIITSN